MPSDLTDAQHSRKDISIRDSRSRKRDRSRSRSPYSKRRSKDRRKDSPSPSRPFSVDIDGGGARHTRERFTRDQNRVNPMKEAEVAEWVAQEDSFVLKQAKKKAVIRVKEGRAKPIDWLAVNLRVIDPERDPLDDEIADDELDVVDPEGILEGLDEQELKQLADDIKVYLDLETNSGNKEYWNTMKVLCDDKYNRSAMTSGTEKRAVSTVSEDIDRLLSSKNLEELETLEKQIEKKLNSNEPIDVDYWSQLLHSLRIWKAKASLKRVYSNVIKGRLEVLRRQQKEDAEVVRNKIEDILAQGGIDDNSTVSPINYSRDRDPEPMLKLPQEDRSLETIDESDFLEQVALERLRVLKLGYVPMKQKSTEKRLGAARKIGVGKSQSENGPSTSRFAALPEDDFSQATHALYEREVARGVGENEEIFVGEEEVTTSGKPAWADKYRPRKPRYFNRVQMGYEWNKYNQTHYDHDNPPPKVVQGYKFNIFYPDLIDKSKAPTYRIEREGGRKRGQSFAPAGEDDTCLIRFIAGPPYEDIAFRIVDKEWDYSAKKERGFKSSFEKGILQLHFQLKKVYYRK